ncbi:ABC transporter permease [Bosea sp. BIWAKO-01]|uniref:ABC transporter permease n=1 Tax=Bosea sp. BIWAKO-01 TaxID=506668 RepID=UPI0008532EE7|nr:ABC transporter permease [Bosea sp. BIWAKO-01]GAU86793.1 dipeptide transport system permease protein DppC [Bosea sp. BIWAKO-01]
MTARRVGISFLGPHNALILLAVVILVTFVAVAAFPGWFTSFDPARQSLLTRLLAPGSVGRGGAVHWLGTDKLGRDVLSGLIYGARGALFIGVAAACSAATIGVSLGLIAGYYGRLTGDIILRAADVQLAFPFFLLAITVAAVLGPSYAVIIAILTMSNWVAYARVVRSETLEIKERAFVEAARAVGASNLRIMVVHILPNCIPSVIVLATFNMAHAIILEAGLSFVGLGVPTRSPSWGAMLAEGREYVATAWWLATFPGIAIFLVVLAVNVLGDRLRDILDPRLSVRD